MGDLQGLMVSICILSKHGSWSCTTKTIQAALAEADTTIITFILAFFNFRISIKTVFPSGLHFSTNILHFLPERDWKTISQVLPVLCQQPLKLPALLGRLFLLSRHFQSSSLHLHLSQSFPKTELVHPSPH